MDEWNKPIYGTNYLKIGDLLIQWGRTTSGASDVVVTFPIPFGEAPIVSSGTSSANGYNGSFRILGITTKQFTQRFLDTGWAQRAGETLDWIAIGHV